jgi:2-oxoisovalerate dehydrogenase E2 component (dihydrolipoyl transacylase)
VAKPVTMPQLGESVTEGTITRWLKAEGDEVEMDEPLAEVDTDKVNAELPSPVAGKIEKFLVSEGSTVDVGTEIALVAIAGETDSPAADAPPQENVAADAPTEEFPASGTEAQPVSHGTERQRATTPADSDGDGRGEIEDAETLRLTRSSPVVRRLAEEHGVEIAEIPGTGTGGRVTRKDIEGYVEQQEEPAAEREEYAFPGRQEEREAFAERERVPIYEGDRIEDLSGIRRPRTPGPWSRWT